MAKLTEQQARVLEVIRRAYVSSVTLRQSENLAKNWASSRPLPCTRTSGISSVKDTSKEPRRSPERSTLSILLK